MWTAHAVIGPRRLVNGRLWIAICQAETRNTLLASPSVLPSPVSNQPRKTPAEEDQFCSKKPLLLLEGFSICAGGLPLGDRLG